MSSIVPDLQCLPVDRDEPLLAGPWYELYVRVVELAVASGAEYDHVPWNVCTTLAELGEVVALRVR